MRSRTPWREKLNKPAAVEVIPGPTNWLKGPGNGQMVIPTPQAIMSYVKEVPAGKVLTVSQLREHLAKDNAAQIACPLTTGIFLRIVAEASEEARREEGAPLAPWWRVVKDDGSLLEKAPGAADGLQAQLLEAEGIAAQPTGKTAKLKVPVEHFAL